MIGWLVQGNIIWVISVYDSQCGLHDGQKDNFYDSQSMLLKNHREESCSHSSRFR